MMWARPFHKHKVMVFLGVVLCNVLSTAAQQASPSRAGESLSAVSDGLTDVTQRILRCVVRVEGDTYLPEQEHYGEKIQMGNNAAAASEVEGAGILVSPDGYIVTNAHVVAGEHRLRVFLHLAENRTEERTASLIGVDQVTDIAVLRIQGGGFPFIDLKKCGAGKTGRDFACIRRSLRNGPDRHNGNRKRGQPADAAR